MIQTGVVAVDVWERRSRSLEDGELPVGSRRRLIVDPELALRQDVRGREGPRGKVRRVTRRVRMVASWLHEKEATVMRKIGDCKEVVMREENWHLRWALRVIFLLLVALGICVGALVVRGVGGA